jgi:hypothetical protein
LARTIASSVCILSNRSAISLAPLLLYDHEILVIPRIAAHNSIRITPYSWLRYGRQFIFRTLTMF